MLRLQSRIAEDYAASMDKRIKVREVSSGPPVPAAGGLTGAGSVAGGGNGEGQEPGADREDTPGPGAPGDGQPSGDADRDVLSQADRGTEGQG